MKPQNDEAIIQQFGGVIFDLDGTLINTLPDIMAALNRVMIEEGFEEISPDQGRTLIGGGAYNLIEKAFSAHGAGHSAGKIETAFSKFLAYYDEKPAARSNLYPGVMECLETLTKYRVKMGICTNKPIDLTQKIIACMGIAEYFGGSVLGGDSLNCRKPDPRHLLEVIKLMGIPEHTALMVGDSETDVQTARNAGIPVVAVDYGYTALHPRDLGSDLLISCMRTLPFAKLGLGLR